MSGVASRRSIRLSVPLTAVLALTAALPATAGDPLGAAVAAVTDGVAAHCTYTGQTRGNGLQFEFGGIGVALTGTAAAPDVVAVTCTLISPAQGLPGEQPELRATTTCVPGGVCAAPVGVTGSWPLRPVMICLSGYTVVEQTTHDIPGSCSASGL